MSLILGLSIAILLLALGWSLLLLRRIRDWRMGFLASMVALMATRQTLTLVSSADSLHLSLGGHATDLAMSVAAFLAVFFLGSMLEGWRRSEAQLAANEAHYRVLAQQARDLIFVIDPDGNYIYLSPASEQMAGWRPEELIGTNAIERGTTEAVTQNERNLLGRFRANELDHVVYESELPHRDGGLIPTEVSASAIRAAHGRLVAVQGTARNISERRRSEAALRESEKNYREVVETTHEMIFHTDAEGVIDFANSAATRLLGHTPNELRGRSFFDFLSDEHIEKDRASFAEIVLAGQTITSHESVALHKDGSRVYVMANARPAFDESGRVGGVTFTVDDVSERKRAEEAVRESEERYRTLIDNVPLGVAAIDRRGHLVAANPQLVALTGAPSMDALAELIDAINGPYLRAAGITEIARRCMEGAESGTAELGWTTRWGRSLDVRLHYAPHRDADGRIQGALGVFEDVTALRQAEEARRRLEKELQQAQKMEAVGALAGGIAHDFNNLLTGVHGGIELALLDLPPDSAVAENLQHATRAAERATELTKQLLSLSRRQESTMAATDVNEVVERIGRLLRRSIAETIEVRTVLGDGIPLIRADAGQLEQALLNLGINARDAMSGRAGTITLVTELAEACEFGVGLVGEARPGAYLRVSVSDSGAGMTPEVVARAFEPFYTTKEPGKGTGLGLAMVYTCVKAHEGWVEVESVPDSGTTIRIYLPLVEIEPQEELAEDKGIPRGDETVLLVDDQDAVISVGRRMLERCGYQVVTARNGREALERFAEREGEVALVVTDLVMPQGDGRALLNALRARGSRVPVLLASGYAPDASPEALAAEGFAAFVSKPYLLNTLARTVRELLDQKAASAAVD